MFSAVCRWVGVRTDSLLAQFGARRSQTIAAFERFVQDGAGNDPIWQHLNRHIFLGDDDFVARAQKRASLRPENLTIPRAQRHPPAPPLKAIANLHAGRNEVIRVAWATGEYSYSQIAEQFGFHFTTVGCVARNRNNG